MPITELDPKIQTPFTKHDRVFYKNKLFDIPEKVSEIDINSGFGRMLRNKSKIIPSANYQGVFSFQENAIAETLWLAFFKFDFILPLDPTAKVRNIVAFLGSYKTEIEATLAHNTAVNFINKKLNLTFGRSLKWNLRYKGSKGIDLERKDMIIQNVLPIMNESLRLFMEEKNAEIAENKNAAKNKDVATISYLISNFMLPFTTRDSIISDDIILKPSQISQLSKYDPWTPSKNFYGVYSIERESEEESEVESEVESEQEWVACLQISVQSLCINQSPSKIIILSKTVPTERLAAHIYDAFVSEALDYLREKRLTTCVKIDFNVGAGVGLTDKYKAKIAAYAKDSIKKAFKACIDARNDKATMGTETFGTVATTPALTQSAAAINVVPPTMLTQFTQTTNTTEATTDNIWDLDISEVLNVEAQVGPGFDLFAEEYFPLQETEGYALESAMNQMYIDPFTLDDAETVERIFAQYMNEEEEEDPRAFSADKPKPSRN